MAQRFPSEGYWKDAPSPANSASREKLSGAYAAQSFQRGGASFNVYGSAPRRRRKGPGCLLVLFVLAVVAVFMAWQLGYVDRWLYEKSLEQAGQEEVPEENQNGALPVSHPQSYAYAQLGEEDQKKYRLVLAALETREAQPYPSEDMDDLQRIFTCVQADHPELFYVDGVSMETVTNRGSGMIERVSVQGRFAYSDSEAQFVKSQIDWAADKCLSGLPADADDYVKSRYLYDWLAEHVAYDQATARSNQGDQPQASHSAAQTMEGALLNGSAVCGGYAAAYQFMMQRLGVQCALVTGKGYGESHAWCLVLLDGEYYYVDPTWADPQSEAGGGDIGYVNHDYLNVTTADMMRTHEFADTIPLPECVATADNYYEREGLLFDSPDEGRLGALASDAVRAGVSVQVRFVDEGSYSVIRDDFVGNGRIGSYLPGGSYRYSCSDENFSITVMGS